MKNKALWGKKYLEIDERVSDLAAPGDDHVIVEVRACGVCGTDINYVRDWPGEPMALGHEIAGEIVETGTNVTHLKPGDRVIVEDCTMCGICTDCKSGQPQFCRNMYNMEGQPGMARYLSVRYNCLNKFDGLDFKWACLTEPLAVSLTSVLNAQIPLGGSVVVLGAGPLGAYGSATGVEAAGSGVCCGHRPPRRQSPGKARPSNWHRNLGCDLTIEAGKQSVADEIKSRFPFAGVDPALSSALRRKASTTPCKSSASAALSPSSACTSGARIKLKST